MIPTMIRLAGVPDTSFLDVGVALVAVALFQA
jgi:hypothetical protein